MPETLDLRTSMKIMDRLDYYRRIFPAYLTPTQSQLTFWHELPEGNDRAQPGVLGEYYMALAEKANYSGQFDEFGIPLLNYHGESGTPV